MNQQYFLRSYIWKVVVTACHASFRKVDFCFVWLPYIWLLLHRLWGDHHGWGLQRRKHLCDNHWLWGHYPWQVCFALIKHDPTNRCLARMCVAPHLVSHRELRKFYFRFQFTVIILCCFKMEQMENISRTILEAISTAFCPMMRSLLISTGK